MAKLDSNLQDDACIDALLTMQQKHVLLIGDIMLDCYVDGVVSRISPEAPVPILNHSVSHHVAGGAANVAHNLATLGISVNLVGLIGADQAGKQLADALSTIPQLTSHCMTLDDRPTTRKTRFRAQGQQILRLDEETTSRLTPEQEQALLDIIEKQIATKPDIIILSDYAKGCLSHQTVASVTDMAAKADIAVITDPKSADFTKYAGSRLLTPNLKELCAAAGTRLEALDEIVMAANTQIAAAQLDAILVTLGSQGMLFVSKDTTMHLPASAIDVFDVSGAGDTVVALVAASQTSNNAWETSIQLANLGAGIVVGKSGTATVSPGEILAHLSSGNMVYDHDTLSELRNLRDSWANNGLKIGFTNGCFDLLHPGHIDSLKRSAKLCDKLIVAVNSDRSVKALKGQNRPIQSESKRASILAKLPFVDAVIVFDENTPKTVIDALSPDILIKGGDYRAEEIVGYETVTKNGGTVEIIPLLEGHSTSRLADM